MAYLPESNLPSAVQLIRTMIEDQDRQLFDARRMDPEYIRHRLSLVSFIEDTCLIRTEFFDIYHLAVRILDRFMSSQTVIVRELWLAGMTSILLAAKFIGMPPAAKLHESEELDRPCAILKLGPEFDYEDLERMEGRVLHAVRWDINLLTAHSFIDVMLASRTLQPVCHIRDWAMTYCSASVQNASILLFKPSTVALTCLDLAMHSHGIPMLSEQVCREVNLHYCYEDIVACQAIVWDEMRRIEEGGVKDFDPMRPSPESVIPK